MIPQQENLKGKLLLGLSNYLLVKLNQGLRKGLVMMDIQDAEAGTIDIPRQRLKRKAQKNHRVESKKARVEQSYEEG